VVTDPQTHNHTHKPTDRTDYNTLHRSVINEFPQKGLCLCSLNYLLKKLQEIGT